MIRHPKRSGGVHSISQMPGMIAHVGLQVNQMQCCQSSTQPDAAPGNLNCSQIGDSAGALKKKGTVANLICPEALIQHVAHAVHCQCPTQHMALTNCPGNSQATSCSICVVQLPSQGRSGRHLQTRPHPDSNLPNTVMHAGTHVGCHFHHRKRTRPSDLPRLAPALAGFADGAAGTYHSFA